MICVSIADVSVDEAVRIIGKNELTEVRLDRIKFSDVDIKGLFSTGKSTVATFRPADSVDESYRKKILIEAIDAGATYVDVEVENGDEFKNEIISRAKMKGCRTIVSYHNYTRTPVMRELEQIMKWCFEGSCDYAKIACQAETVEDCSRLLSLYSLGKPVISIGMGDLGKITRIAAPLLGAPFTYASLDDNRKTAPGQFDYESLRSIIEMIRKS